MQHEIVERSPLLDSAGTLTQRGWARYPLLDCNLEDAHVYRRARILQWFRVKRWDYYGVLLPEGYFSATIADLGYAGQVFIYFVDFETKEYHEETATIPFGKGVLLPRNSDEGPSAWSGKAGSVAFAVDGKARSASVEWADFAGQSLQAELEFAAPDESTVIATPIGERRFYYNRKVNCMPVTGSIRFADRTLEVNPEDSSGILDWGRGVWEYSSFWVWASGSGFLTDGRRVGLNMGYGFGENSAATENTVILDGRIHKLEAVEFDYNSGNFVQPWTMQSDRLDITFTPSIERAAKTNLLLIRSEVHQMVGTYSGTAIDDIGNEIAIDGVPGWAEEHQARW